MSSQRSADGVLLPETAISAKRARGDKDEENVRNFIIVSPRTIQTTGEDEHPKSISVSDIPGAALKGDGVVFQSSHQMSSEDRDALEIERGALLALDGNSTDFAEERRNRVQSTELSQDNVPSNSNIRPDYASSPSPDKGSQYLKEASNRGIPASSEQDRQFILQATLDTERNMSRLSNSQRADNPSQSTAAAQKGHHASGLQAPGTSPIAQNSQSLSINDPAPHPDGSLRFNDELTTMLRSPHSGPFQSMTQDTDRATLQTSNQTFTQNVDARSQPYPLQKISSTDTTVGKTPPDRLNADPFDKQTGSAMYTLSSNATMPAADSMDRHQAPVSRQLSSQQWNKSRSDDVSEAWRGEGDSLVGPNQPQSSTHITNPNSIPHGMGPENRSRPVEHSHASSHLSSRLGVPRPPAGTQAPHPLSIRPPPLPRSPIDQPGFSMAPQNNYQPPAVQFTIDNRYKSALSPVDVQPLLEIFSRHVKLLLGPETPTITYPVGTLMWQNSPDFYKWYMAESGIAEVSVLRFGLLDVHSQPEKVLLVSGDNLYHFQILKQHIWNLFWVASYVNRAPTPIRILINAAIPVTSEPPQCSSAPALLAEPSTAASLKNVRADPPAAIIHRVRHASPPTSRAQGPQVHFAAPPLHTPRPGNSGTATRQTHFPPVQANHLGRTTQTPQLPDSIRDLTSPIHGVGTSMNAGTDVLVTQSSKVTDVCCDSRSRTASDQHNLRKIAVELVGYSPYKL
jgi:hypothetical protein